MKKLLNVILSSFGLEVVPAPAARGNSRPVLRGAVDPTLSNFCVRAKARPPVVTWPTTRRRWEAK